MAAVSRDDRTEGRAANEADGASVRPVLGIALERGDVIVTIDGVPMPWRVERVNVQRDGLGVGRHRVVLELSGVDVRVAGVEPTRAECVAVS